MLLFFYFQKDSQKVPTQNSSRNISVRDILKSASSTPGFQASSLPSNIPSANSVDSIIADMTGKHEGCLEGQPEAFSWNKKPEADNPVPPPNYSAMTYWGVIYADCAGNQASNTRVQVANMKAYALLKSIGKWQLIQSQGRIDGCYYSEDWKTTECSLNTRSGTVGQSIKLSPHMLVHFYAGDGRSTIDTNDVVGMFITGQARLILDNSSLPDDRVQAKLLMDLGGDWWQNENAPYPNNEQIGLGKFKYLKSDWRTFNMILTKDSFIAPSVGEEHSHTISSAPIIANPPPVN